MLQEEVIDIIVEELIDFAVTYIMMTSFTHEALHLKVTNNKKLEFGQYGETWNGKTYFHARHSITKSSRTKVGFWFQFHEDEYKYAMDLIKLLDGYVNYGFSNHGSRGYNCCFTMDVGSKANCQRFFDELDFFNDEEMK